MSHETAVDLPAQTRNGVSGEQEGKFLLDLRDLPVTAKHIEPGKKAPDFLLDEGDFPAGSVIDMELFAPGEHFPFNDIFIFSIGILDRELIAPGKDLFFYVELHRLPPSFLSVRIPIIFFKYSISIYENN